MMRSHKPILVGIDVAARTLQVAVSAKGRMFDEVYPNDAIGHLALLNRLSRYKTPIRVCVEATGTYSLDVCCALSAGNHPVMLLNPRASMHHAKAKMRRAKTDKVDARALSEIAGGDGFMAWKQPSQAVNDFRATMRRVNSLVKSGADERNRLAAAQATRQTPRFVLEDLKASIDAIDARVARVRKHALSLVRGDAELTQAHRVLISMPGVGEAAALAIAAEIFALPREMTAPQVVAYAGLDPKPKETGGPEMGHRSISRYGNSHLRKAMFFPAMTAMRMDGPFKAIGERLIARGKDKMVALVAIMRRMLTVAWKLVVSGETFDPTRVGKRVVSP